MKYQNIITKYIYATIGFLLVSYYIWFRFIRERLPRMIPLQLTFFYLVILVVIITGLLFTLKQVFYPKSPGYIQQQIQNILIRISVPMRILNDIVYENVNFVKICAHIINYSTFLLNLNHIFNNGSLIVFTLFILPKICLLLAFFLDVFILQQFYYTYKVILIAFIPLLAQYFFYTCKKITDILIAYLDEWYMVIITSQDTDNPDDPDDISPYFVAVRNLDSELDLKDFIPRQSCAYMFDYKLYEYKALISWQLWKKYMEDNSLPNKLYYSKDLTKILEKELYVLTPIVLKLNLLYEAHSLGMQEQKGVMEYVIIFICTIYLISWIYILFISIHTLPPDSFKWLQYLIPSYANPFH